MSAPVKSPAAGISSAGFITVSGAGDPEANGIYSPDSVRPNGSILWKNSIYIQFADPWWCIGRATHARLGTWKYSFYGIKSSDTNVPLGGNNEPSFVAHRFFTIFDLIWRLMPISDDSHTFLFGLSYSVEGRSLLQQGWSS